MRILAIETSGRDATLAALLGDGKGEAQLLRESAIVGPDRTAQCLAPRLQELLQAVDWQPSAIELIAVAVGPGSFTGLRIGVTTAKTLAYAVGAQVIGVNTLEAIASQAPKSKSPLWVVMDAQRQELFAAKFVDGRRVVDTTIMKGPAWLKLLQVNDCVSGPGLRRIREDLPNQVDLVEEANWQPLAARVGALGWREYVAGQRSDVWALAPQYFRPSAAEENHAK